jgi:hypothetical protein
MATPTRRPTVTRRIARSSVAGTPIPGERIPQAAPHEEIARRAYALFIARGGTHGQDLADWFQAEREVLTAIWRGRVA